MNGKSNDKLKEIFDPIKAYFKGVKAEWGRISWPEKSQISAETISVIIIVFTFTIIIYLMDLVFKGILSLIH